MDDESDLIRIPACKTESGMTMAGIEKSIIATKQAFENRFSSGTFYNKQTQDELHLKAILEFLPIKAEKESIRNISFVTYDSINFPFHENEFDMVISRYALHHFPDIQKSILEVSRILKPDGFLFISDPAPNGDDTSRFVDESMQLKKDGHIKFYTEDEWKQIGMESRLKFVESFGSSIRFPKEKDTAYGFQELLKKHDKCTIESYQLKVLGNEIYITEQVNNILFCKLAL